MIIFTSLIPSYFTLANDTMTEAATKLQIELRQLKHKFAELHAESLNSPVRKRNAIGLLMVMRYWEPMSFSQYRKG